MLRRIIEIDEEKCNGCGLCAKACHEGAIGMVNGKAKLMHEHYCDGLGDCLPACPTGAIRFVEREAPAYDEGRRAGGKRPQRVRHTGRLSRFADAHDAGKSRRPPAAAGNVPSQLRQWPVQIKLVSPAAPYFDGADLLIAADCTAYAYGNFHSEFMRGKVTLIGCPKLDAVQYAEKAHRDLCPERHPLRHAHAHGGAVLRRDGVRHPHRVGAGREGDPVPHRRPLDRRRDSGGTLTALFTTRLVGADDPVRPFQPPQRP